MPFVSPLTPTGSPLAGSTRPYNYINADYSLKSWLFTVDHKRIALMYLAGVTFFFVVGGLLAFFLRLELLTPDSDLMASSLTSTL